jgi:hypothetical protein
MNYINESSYCVDIHYDAIFDDIHFVSRYRFDTEELVNQFISIAEEKYRIICSSIQYEEKRSIMGYSDEHPYRPKFYHLDVALLDLEQLILYCNNYYNTNKKYIYDENIFVEPMDEFQYLYSEKLNIKLKKQIEEMEQNIKNIPKIISENKYSLEELEDIIKACNEQINQMSENIK